MPASKDSHAARSLYVRTAHYYYRGGLTQEQIARKLGLTRQRVNRILGECVELGIVKISIEGEEGLNLSLESALEQRFGLLAARVTDVSAPEEFQRELGRAAAVYLAETLRDGDTVGFSRGRAVSALADAMPPVKAQRLTVTQLMGGWNTRRSGENVDDIVHRFAQRTGASPLMLYAPVLADSRETRDNIMKESYFVEAYEAIKSCRIAVVGIGGAGNRYRLTIGQGPSQEDIYWDAITQTAVGEVCTCFFDREGNLVPSELYEHVIAVARDDLMRIPLRIGVAGSPEKRRPILAAIRGGFINALVTDSDTAKALLEKED